MFLPTNYRFAEGGVDVNDDQLWSATYAPWLKNLNHAFTKEQTKEEDCCFANTIGYVSLFPLILFLYAFLVFFHNMFSLKQNAFILTQFGFFSNRVSEANEDEVVGCHLH